MKEKRIRLYEMSKISKSVKVARNRACNLNIYSTNAKRNLSKLISPDTNKNYFLEGNVLSCKSGIKIKILNGIPDFTIFSKNALEEKNKQADYHDDESLNETFEEIVLRPYNYNKLHAKVWLGHLKEFTPIIEKIINKNFDQLSILNCGCGGGFEAQFFAEQGAKVTGFDISQLRVEAASTRFALNNLDGFFYRGDAAIIPFPDNSFDLVIYHDSLHHVPIEEIPVAIREACRVSKLGVMLFEAHDSPFRMMLESIGLSKSIESSGNYTFRFRKSLIHFWCVKYNMRLSLYSTRFMKKEHRPKIFKRPTIGNLFYLIIKLVGIILRPLGNEALIFMQKV